MLGTTHQGRQLIALKVTEDARDKRDGSRPAVLYSSTQHAREWISAEVNRRLLHHFVDGWRAKDKEIRGLLERTELWFVVVANPDGYQYTFDPSGCGARTSATTTATGRSASATASTRTGTSATTGATTTRAPRPIRRMRPIAVPAPPPSPRPRAMQGLIDRVRPKMHSNIHSFGQWLLYPQGWQVGTLDADNPLYVALGGTDADPAIPGFNPGQSADTLYVTNGETTDYAESSAGTIAYTPELGEGTPGAGFVFPDDEGLIQAEFEKTLPFHMGLARSARRPETPVSPVGIDVEPFYLDQDDIDPQNGQQSLFDFKFAVSYGNPQQVRVLAKRSLGKVTLRYQVNGGRVQQASTSEWNGGEDYGPGNDVYYHVVGGQVTGTRPGDSVKVWFTAAPRGERLLHLPRPVRQRATGPDRRGGGLHRRLAGPAARADRTTSRPTRTR